MNFDLTRAKGATFDLDGLLLEGSETATKAANEALLYSSKFWEQFKNIAELESVNDLNPHPGQDLIHKFQWWILEAVTDEANRTTLFREFAKFTEHWRKSIGEVFAEQNRDIKPLPGAQQALDHFAGRLVVVTNNQRSVVITSIADSGLNLHGARIITADEFPNKPDSLGQTAACNKLDCKPGQLVALGDNEIDLTSAVRANIGQLVLVNAETDMLRRSKFRNDPRATQVASLEDINWTT